MTSRLFVGNLPFATSADQLRDLFAAAGEVQDISVPTDRFTGGSRGFAFIDMVSPDGAAAAVAQLNGIELEGRVLRVDVAAERGAAPSAPSPRFGADLPSRRARPKGSRRNVRARRRGF